MLKLNSKKISETNFMFKRQKRQLKLRRELKQKSVSVLEKNYKLLKNSR